MNMYIVMNMNIYITKENEEFLQAIKPTESMSGIVNKLLDDYRDGKGPDIFPPAPPIDILKQGEGGRYNGDSPIAEEELEPPKKTKVNICKQHGIDKNLCRMMKHK